MLVDVMLPAYGDGVLTRIAVDSVLAQDSPHWRLTVVDDGRDSGLGEYVGAVEDPRVRYLLNPERLGINRNFQRCVDLAEGDDDDLVVVFGSDDVMAPHYVRSVLDAAARHPEVVAVHPGVRVVDADGAPARTAVDTTKAVVRGYERWSERVRGGEELASSLLVGNWMYFPAVAFRRGALRRHGFTPGLDITLDLDLYLALLLEGGRFLFTHDVCFAYRRHAASLSSLSAGWGSRFTEERAFFSAAGRRTAAHGWPRAARSAHWHITSRLNALSRCAAAVLVRDRAAQRRLLAHAVARS